MSKQIPRSPSTLYLWIEMAALFLGTPLLIVLPIHSVIKLTCVLGALIYCVIKCHQQSLFKKTYLIGNNWRKLSITMLARFSLFVLASTLLVWLFLPESLFSVVLNNPVLWIAISVFYSVFSVYPQEFLYRLFFFERYKNLVSNPTLFIVINASLFSFAHIFFQNILVFVLTFVGGIIFALTYKKRQSLLLVSIEHSAYGVWLFTLGLGKMLAFPGA
ncbi:CPBP family glutamic-type intramembrane protease [Paraglaciecola sp.]|uniref:CPBP family glutamic-type intramembrane protease n=1 Tax=Paraglaciecola sp. TaxID=1920173 RepID=UPI003EF1DC9A